jgi:hypothetical protein
VPDATRTVADAKVTQQTAEEKQAETEAQQHAVDRNEEEQYLRRLVDQRHVLYYGFKSLARLARVLPPVNAVRDGGGDSGGSGIGGGCVYTCGCCRCCSPLLLFPQLRSHVLSLL